MCDPIKFYRFYSEVLSNLTVENPADSWTLPFQFHHHGRIVIASISSAGLVLIFRVLHQCLRAIGFPLIDSVRSLYFR